MVAKFAAVRNARDSPTAVHARCATDMQTSRRKPPGRPSPRARVVQTSAFRLISWLIQTPIQPDTAVYVDRLFRGAKLSQLPIQFPTKFELVVNLKAAKAIGLTIPEAFLLRAER